MKKMNENYGKAEGKSLPNRRKESTYCRRAYGTFLVAGYWLLVTRCHSLAWVMTSGRAGGLKIREPFEAD
jgi:hypothetical protein